MPDDQGGANSEARREDCSPDAEALPPNAIRSQLDKLLSSPSFVNSPQLCRLLRFVVEQETSGQGDQLKEYLLGIEVLGKNEGFDPRIDPVCAPKRRLLRKLSEYYQSKISRIQS